MSLEQFSNTYIWSTHLDGASGTILLQKRTVTSGILVDQYALGASSAAQILSNEYTAFPFAVGGDAGAEIVYVFGRMNNPFSLGDPVHIIKTENGGTTWEVVENSWGADFCSTMGVIPLTNEIQAIRDQSSTGSAYYNCWFDPPLQHSERHLYLCPLSR